MRELPAVHYEQPQPSKADTFLAQKSKITIELSDGTFMLPIIAAKKSTYGLILFLPSAEDSMVFLPKPGSQMKIKCVLDGRPEDHTVYYPGTYADVPELGAIVMCLVLADTDGEA
jgi:hypothetical protein